MITHWRPLLALTAVASAVLGSVGLALAVAVSLEILSAHQAQPIVLPAFTLVFPVAFIGVLLFAEIATKNEVNEPWYLRTGGLHFSRLPELVQNCPRRAVRVSLFLAAVALCLVLLSGRKATWTVGKVLSSQEVIIFAAGAACLSFLVLPLSLSAYFGRQPPRSARIDDA
jgi:hypothetical protein